MSKIDEIRSENGIWHTLAIYGAYGNDDERDLYGDAADAMRILFEEIDRLTADLAIAQREAAQAQKEWDAAQGIIAQQQEQIDQLERHIEAKSAISQGYKTTASFAEQGIVDLQNQLAELAQHRQAVEDGRWVELPCLVNKRSIVKRGPNGKLRCVTFDTPEQAEAAILKEGTE